MLLLIWPAGENERKIIKMKNNLHKTLFWGSFLVLLIEGYVDFVMGAWINLEELHWASGDDIFSSCCAILITPIVVVFPFFVWFFMHKNILKFNKEEFKTKYSSMYLGLQVNFMRNRLNTAKILFWFLLRRFLTIWNVVVFSSGSSVWMVL